MPEPERPPHVALAIRHLRRSFSDNVERRIHSERAVASPWPSMVVLGRRRARRASAPPVERTTHASPPPPPPPEDRTSDEDPERKKGQKIDLLRNWIDYANECAKLHQASASHFRTRTLCMSVPSVVLSTAVGTTGVSGVLSSLGSGAGIVVGLASFVAAVFTAMLQLMRPTEVQASHSFHAVEFEKLAREIDVELVLQGTSNRTFASRGEFIKDCRDRLDRLVDRAPSIPEFVKRRVASSPR